ncbi:hypothetical protein A1O3_01896 [Capronia epimyces CBS 606.96]|uniref:Rad51-like C-terminal domain-containing protein n=1 Tax=Capronia epimyces CBS 606.96 TaxID=1182542 RepID=W9Y7N8_9EURO|nr:uncharacterized protein A1O3_01896 [Capronia epimyces CBS 606.96]EXJ88832.1 hypothetical protein A1O3_01896 [Capronia epimyces CBS 606.96]
MSVEQYGARLLAEVQEEGLDKLDKLLEAVRYPPEPQPATRSLAWDPATATATAAVPNRALEDEELAEHDDPDNAPIYGRTQGSRSEQIKAKPPTIELSSRKSGAGKTNLLYYLCTLAALPQDIGGKSATVVYIDSDARFSATRLMQIMQHHIITARQSTTDAANNTENTTTTDLSVPKGTTAEVKDRDTDTEIALEALQHIHVFRPQSSSQVVSVLDSLPSYLLDRSRHPSFYRGLSLVVLDSATAFYWQDRFDRDMARLGLASPGVDVSSSPGPSPTAEIIERLKAIQHRFECVVAFSTNHPSPPPVQSYPSRSARVHARGGNQSQDQIPTTPSAPLSLAPAVTSWTSYATLTLDLSRAQILQFAPHMTLEECLRDADKRVEAVRHAQFIAKVRDGPGQLTGIQPERDPGRPAAFTFKIGDDGVDVE